MSLLCVQKKARQTAFEREKNANLEDFISRDNITKTVVSPWKSKCQIMVTLEADCFLFYKDADGCGAFKTESELVLFSKAVASL